jgi:hypothetical protein
MFLTAKERKWRVRVQERSRSPPRWCVGAPATFLRRGDSLGCRARRGALHVPAAAEAQLGRPSAAQCQASPAACSGALLSSRGLADGPGRAARRAAASPFADPYSSGRSTAAHRAALGGTVPHGATHSRCTLRIGAGDAAERTAEDAAPVTADPVRRGHRAARAPPQ